MKNWEQIPEFSPMVDQQQFVGHMKWRMVKTEMLAVWMKEEKDSLSIEAGSIQNLQG